MIEEISIADESKWDTAVRKCSCFDVFYLSAYMKAFQMQGAGIPVLIVYSNKEDYSVNAIFIRDVAEDSFFCGKIEKNVYYDISSQYGYGGFIGIVSDWTVLENEWKRYCSEHSFICEFERFNLFSDYHKYFKGNVVSRTHNVVRNLEISIDEIWMDFKQKVRKNVKRANKYELRIIIENTGDYMDDFLRIYYGTMERTEAEEGFFFKKEFFEKLNQMKDNICYFHAVYHNPDTGKDQVISTELVLYGSENAYSYLGGTDREYFDMRPNDFLKWEIIKWAKGKGLKNFVLGGGYGADDGIFFYKSCLAPNGVVDFYIGERIFDQGRYDCLVGLRKDNISERKTEGYFPEYRI